MTPQDSKVHEEGKEPSIHDDWKQYFEEEELERVFTYYKAVDSIIKEEEIESDKSKDSSNSSSDDSDLDDLSENELKENIYISVKQEAEIKAKQAK